MRYVGRKQTLDGAQDWAILTFLSGMPLSHHVSMVQSVALARLYSPHLSSLTMTHSSNTQLLLTSLQEDD